MSLRAMFSFSKLSGSTHVSPSQRPFSHAKLGLTDALSSSDPAHSSSIINSLLLDRARVKLEEARKTAARRSGARGKDARAAEIAAEAAVLETEQKYFSPL